ncbi:uncharacterized protein LOC133033738 [Cannabis sativa]|uniref:uncharacterized protein LOC133033738 n=1 Tax=Cannabis sativa TaxID=3483 RepID=UPI0029CA5660|nr:uncharacterized protein LOC133033738 [Cannabis sativa]
MLAQNKTLQQIDEKLSTVTHKVIQINEVFSKVDTVMTRLVYKISQVHEELLQMAKSKKVPQEIFLAKEAELKGLKSQYVSMQTQSKDGLPLTAGLDSTPWMFSTLPKSAQPLASPPKMGDQILRLKRILDEEDQLKRKKKQDNQGQCSTQLMINLNEEISSDDESSDDDEISSSPSQSDDWETDDQSSSDEEAIPPQFMTTNHTTAASGVEREQNFDPTEPIIEEEEVSSKERHKSTKHQFSGKPNTFMLDDLPPNQWRSRFQEFRAWTLLEAQKPRAEIRDILLQLVSRFTGILQDWWQSLGEYRQLQFLQAYSIEAALNHLYVEFCGQDSQVVERFRGEFFKMKCCSMKKEDLELHFQRMTKRFYLIGGVDDPNLKQAFLASIPEPLGEETFRLLSANNRTLQNTTFGELFQMVMRALDKMCSQNKFLQEYMKQTKQLDRACNQKGLTIKCSTKDTCSCSKQKDEKKKSFKYRSSRRKTPWKFLRKKKNPGKTSNRCFSCGKKGHFAKECPKGKTAKMITHIEDATGVSLSDNDVESIFSVDDEISPNTMCALQLSSDSDDDRYGGLFSMHAFPAGQPIPIAKMHVIPTKYSRPIKVAAFFDMGASYTIINPDILPPELWKKKKQ